MIRFVPKWTELEEVHKPAVIITIRQASEEPSICSDLVSLGHIVYGHGSYIATADGC